MSLLPSDAPVVSLTLLCLVVCQLTEVMSSHSVFFGIQRSDAISARRFIDNSLESYRKELGKIMNHMDNLFIHIDEWNTLLVELSDVHVEWKELCMLLPHMHERNEFVAQRLLRTSEPHLILGLMDIPAQPFFPVHEVHVNMTCYTSVQQLFVHLGRDWGNDGEEVRDNIYRNGILSALSSHIHQLDTESTEAPVKVLVPGAGMGRLAMEIAASGPFE